MLPRLLVFLRGAWAVCVGGAALTHVFVHRLLRPRAAFLLACVSLCSPCSCFSVRPAAFSRAVPLLFVLFAFYRSGQGGAARCRRDWDECFPERCSFAPPCNPLLPPCPTPGRACGANAAVAAGRQRSALCKSALSQAGSPRRRRVLPDNVHLDIRMFLTIRRARIVGCRVCAPAALLVLPGNVF